MSEGVGNRPLRVAFLMPGVGVVRRGAELFVLELAAALSREEDFEIEILSRGPAPLPGHRVRALPRDSPLHRVYAATRLGRKVLDTLFLDPINLEWATATLSAWPRLRRGGYDLAVIEGGLVGGWVGRWLRRRIGLPFIDVAHGNSPKWEVAFARQRPDRVVTFTREQAAMLQWRVPGAAIEVIPHGVDLGVFDAGVEPVKLPVEPPVVLAAGSVDAQKRIHLALEAVARLERGSLVVLGEGAAAADLDARAKRLLGTGRYLRTVLDRHELPAWYAAADVFTLPSASEAFGLVYLEAAACGTPSVAPDDPVRREVLGEAALYTEVENLASYAATLAEALARDWGDQPRRRAEELSFSATVDSYSRLFRQVAAAS